jgi:Tol biopolymer transport system component
MKRITCGVLVLIALIATCVGVFGQRGAGARRQIMLFDRAGKLIKTVGDPGPQGTMTISPDGKKVAAARQGVLNVYDVATGAFTAVGSGTGTQPVWSADSTKIAFQSSRSGNGTGFYVAPANAGGTEELQYSVGPVPTLTGWSNDGRYLLYSATDPASPETGNDLWAVQIVGEKKALVLMRTPAAETGPRISPDGRFLSYRSNESGTNEFHIRPFDSANPTVLPAGPSVKVSNGIGTAGLRWRSDGKEVYYISADGKWMSVEISTTPALKAGTPVELFPLPPAYLSAQQTAGFSDVSADGKIFALFVPATQ